MKHLFLLFLLISINLIFAQSSNDEESVNQSKIETTPQAPGCEANDFSTKEDKICFQKYVLNYIAENYEYPDKARQLDIQGKIYVNFMVEKDASVSNVKIVRGISVTGKEEQEAAFLAEQEVIRVVKSLSFEGPAYQRGKPSKTSFTLPVNLTLEEASFWDLFKRRD